MIQDEMDMAWTQDQMIVVQKRIRDAIFECNLVGLTFVEVRNREVAGKISEKVWCIECQTTLPPMQKEALEEVPEWRCKTCGRPGYNLKGKPIYIQDDHKNMPDFAVTSERFGEMRCGMNSYFLLISPKACEMFLNIGLRSCRMLPVVCR